MTKPHKKTKAFHIAALILGALILVGFLLTQLGILGCATASQSRSLPEIHAEGQTHGPNIRDWPEDLQKEWEHAYRRTTKNLP